jgi:hypothetical protein
MISLYAINCKEFLQHDAIEGDHLREDERDLRGKAAMKLKWCGTAAPHDFQLH